MRVTTTLDDEHAEYVEKVREEENLDSDAAAVRECIDRAREHADARQRVEECEQRVEELRDQLAAANNRIDATNEIVRYVESEKTLEEKRRSAGLATRTKWWLFGMDDE